MYDKQKRLQELRAKKTLDNKEMEELVKLSPKGSFKMLPNAFSIGVTDLDRSIKNAEEANVKLKEAFEKGFYLEVISLGIQKIEYWLRMYWVAKNERGKIFSENDKRTFGMILHDCKKMDFDEDLYSELKSFNEARIDGIHKYFLGKTDYNSLKKVSLKVPIIVKKVSKYIGSEIGLPLN